MCHAISSNANVLIRNYGPHCRDQERFRSVAHKPWYAMTGSQVQSSSPTKSRCHMYHHCKQQAHFDQKRFWQIDRFTVNGHGMAPYTMVKCHRLDSPLCCMLSGHCLTPVMQPQKHFSSLMFLQGHPSFQSNVPICDPAGSGWEEHKWGMYSSFRQTDSDALARLSC